MAEWVADTKSLAAGSIAFSYRWSKKDYPVVKDNHTAFGMKTDSLTIILKLNAGTIIKVHKISKIYKPQWYFMKKSS